MPTPKRETQRVDFVVPSRGRAGLEKGTLAQLSAAGIRAKVVVEPHEVEAYKAAHKDHDVVSLPDSNRGLMYSRNFILQWAHERKLTWLWMLDDDIRQFHENYANKNHKVDAKTALYGAMNFFVARTDVGQAALDYSQLAWSSTKPFTLNSYCDVAVCMHVPNLMRIGAKYDASLLMKEDRDITLQVLSAGLFTCRVQRFSFAAPKNGSNKGGLHEEYAEGGREAESSKRLSAKWGKAIVEPVTKTDGRPDAKIHWGYFQPWKKARKV